MRKTVPTLPPDEKAVSTPAWYDEVGQGEVSHCLTVYFAGKQVVLPWIHLVHATLLPANGLLVAFPSHEVELRYQRKGEQLLPIDELMDSLRYRRLDALYHLPDRGVQIKVFLIQQSEDGPVREEI